MNRPAADAGFAAAPLQQRVFSALADGALHSGVQLASEQGVSRSAIWKAVGALQALGLSVGATPNRGYRLATPLTPLDAAQISARIAPALRARLRRGAVAWSLPSTNAELLARELMPERGGLRAGEFEFLLAEYQTAGRGRRSRPWMAPPGGALCLSLAWNFAALPRGAAALSLAVGVCARRALAALGTFPLRLKWPNDLLVNERKLGGILIELRAESAGPAHAVIGIGINCALGAATVSRVQAAGTDPIDLAACGVRPCDRNLLAALLINEIATGVLEFERHGLAGFAAEWREADALAGRVVTVSVPGGEFVGHARGIDADGALCVQGSAGVQRFHSAEVSVRAQA